MDADATQRCADHHQVATGRTIGEVCQVLRISEMGPGNVKRARSLGLPSDQSNYQLLATRLTCPWPPTWPLAPPPCGRSMTRMAGSVARWLASQFRMDQGCAERSHLTSWS